MGNFESMLTSIPKHRLKLTELDTTGSTPLFWAARLGNLSAIKALVGAGVDINLGSASGKTPLIGACIETSNAECFDWLLQNGADPYRADSKGSHCLTAACCLGSLHAVKALVESGFDVETRDHAGMTGLGWAVNYDHESIAAYLLQHGASFGLENKAGWTPVLDAVLRNSHRCLKLLLKKGANYRFVSRHGWSILHCAASTGDLKTMEILTEHGLKGVDVGMKSSKGFGTRTAEEVFLAQRLKHPGAETLLLAFRRLLAAVEKANLGGEEMVSQDEKLDETDDVFHEAVEYQQ
ncbi:ankyrin repeat-containing domain protein [Cercophora newfieldiana]|uniref:Ankyrin repeat-containing domain protein n=1 Tax=Cercophora newfieldiana TaxID=92897 RepID=A0AA40CI76_9PEZI|nr:ankyrin repeat-containing domain protein [Cercophora newfieldiana]